MSNSNIKPATTTKTNAPALQETLEQGIHAIADKGLYVGLGAVFLLFGAMKFTAYEAGAIAGLISNSPFVGFTQSFLGNGVISIAIGLVELTIGGLLFARFFSPKLSAIGAAGAAATFLLTFSFFFTTPGVFANEGGEFIISVLPGQFLFKDLGLLLASVVLLSESLKAARS